MRVWDPVTGQQHAVLAGHTDWVRAVAPDGTWLANASDDKTARVWDPATGGIMLSCGSSCQSETAPGARPVTCSLSWAMPESTCSPIDPRILVECMNW